MDSVNVNKAELISTLEANRAQHVADYEEAKAAYRQKCVDALNARADEIADGAKINLYFDLPTPETHEDDFTDAITKLQWHQADSVDLNQSEFNQWVLNKWPWADRFFANTTSYTAGASLR